MARALPTSAADRGTEMLLTIRNPPPYADGEPRPAWRGMVHLLGSTLIILGLAALVPLSVMYPDWSDFILLLAGFLVGKLASYVASAYLHRSKHTCTSLVAHKRAMQVDFFAVNISILSTAIPTAVHHIPLYYTTACVLTAVSGVLIVLEWELARLVVTMTQFPLTVAFIGYTTYWNAPFWLAGSVSYVAAFACFGPVAARQGKGAELQEATLPWAPWHQVGRNGCHEDFHNFLFMADVLYLVNACTFGPTCR